MQVMNKPLSKKMAAYTWYIYPIVGAVLGLIIAFMFSAFHQPSRHQVLSLFVSASLKDDSFTKTIKNHYEEEDLREFRVNASLPNSSGFTRKLNLYLTDSDFLLLDETTVNKYKDYSPTYFVPLDGTLKDLYAPANATYFAHGEHDYGIRMEDDCWLRDYFLLEDKTYYLFLSTSSKNLGALYDEKNEPYDNALTAIKLLLEGA